jgi:hypothetical protein
LTESTGRTHGHEIENETPQKRQAERSQECERCGTRRRRLSDGRANREGLTHHALIEPLLDHQDAIDVGRGGLGQQSARRVERDAARIDRYGLGRRRDR